MRIFAADNYQNTTLPNIRLMKETGTGPLWDMGVYCINASRLYHRRISGQSDGDGESADP